jgi:hypothetical protein
MTPLAYTGFRPTSRYIGFVWRGVAIIGVEIAPDAFGFVICGLWIGFIKEGE